MFGGGSGGSGGWTTEVVPTVRIGRSGLLYWADYLGEPMRKFVCIDRLIAYITKLRITKPSLEVIDKEGILNG